MDLMVYQVHLVGLDRKVDMVRCLEVLKAGVVSLDYPEDVVLQADLDLKASNHFAHCCP